MTWIVTYSGAIVDLQNPDPSSFRLEDIAHGLANLCRFNGHTREFYSVAQHSVLASRYVPRAFAYDALMHDAAEAYLGDVTAPLKALLPEYRAIEKRLEAALFERFGVGFPLSPHVKRIDMVMLATERRDLMPQDGPPWPCLENIAPHARRIYPVPPRAAVDMFLRRFEELKPKGIPA